MLPLLYSLTLFCSAFLLFQVQPMVGKMLLPKLGGTPAAWNACMVFFQAALLAGYGYAHAAATRLGSRRSTLFHLGLLILPVIVLPVAIGEDAFRSTAASEHPAVLVLVQLTLAVGLPFFVISTTAPLLQRWFADTGHKSARDPYFLYAASNLGSMVALIAYPVVVEPLLPLDRQSVWWMWGYALCGGLVALCGATLWRKPGLQLEVREAEPGTELVSWRRRLRWVGLAFVPSSLLLGCTTYISTDIAPIPLLWVVPLALYLLTFIIVFSKRPWIPHRLACQILPLAVLMLSLVLLTGATDIRGLPVWSLLAIHLLAFFLAALVGHGELARDRPGPARLTEFYLAMSVGGVLGGAFNALLAPMLFAKTGLTEYPLMLVLACLLRPASPKSAQMNRWDFALPFAVGLLAFGLVLLSHRLELEAGPLRTAVSFGLPCVLVYMFVERVPRFALGIAALLAAGMVNPDERQLFFERNFFGVVKVVDVTTPDGGRFRRMVHGNTVHGQMNLDATDADGRREPLSYYYPSGPIGIACKTWFTGKGPLSVGAVGLGTGSLAYYARPGDRWTFYEIDPAVRRVAEDPRFFTYMSECRAGVPEVILGDAYLRLQEAEEHRFDVLILDAFSSDSIPVHLLTREAIALYRSRLKPGGLMAFHVSNRYLNLRPILARLADDAGLSARGWHDIASDRGKEQGKSDSIWVIMAEREVDFGPVVWPRGMDNVPDARWMKLTPLPTTPLWTNNYSNLLGAFGKDDED